MTRLWQLHTHYTVSTLDIRKEHNMLDIRFRLICLRGCCKRGRVRTVVHAPSRAQGSNLRGAVR